jgi:hypothetical protein
MNFAIGDIVEHMHRKHRGYVRQAFKPWFRNYHIRDEEYDIAWFDEELNNRHRAGMRQIEHGHVLAKVKVT